MFLKAAGIGGHRNILNNLAPICYTCGMSLQFKFKNDKYKKARGGRSRLLEIICVNCQTPLFKYQKDGPGILKRLYIDRIEELKNQESQLICPKCKEHLGNLIIYEKENRPAYRLFVGAITKKIVKPSKSN